MKSCFLLAFCDFIVIVTKSRTARHPPPAPPPRQPPHLAPRLYPRGAGGGRTRHAGPPTPHNHKPCACPTPVRKMWCRCVLPCTFTGLFALLLCAGGRNRARHGRRQPSEPGAARQPRGPARACATRLRLRNGGSRLRTLAAGRFPSYEFRARQTCSARHVISRGRCQCRRVLRALGPQAARISPRKICLSLPHEARMGCVGWKSTSLTEPV